MVNKRDGREYLDLAHVRVTTGLVVAEHNQLHQKRLELAGLTGNVLYRMITM